MKNKYVRGISSVLATVLLLTGMTGCSSKSASVEPMEIEEVYSYSFDAIGGKDVMPLIGFHGPYRTSYGYNGNNFADNLSDEWYQAVADCGINVLSAPRMDYASAPDAVMKSLDLAAKYGIAQTVWNSNITDNFDITVEQAVKYRKEYANHPGFAGHYVYDEPGNSGYFSYLTNMSQLVNITEVLSTELGEWNYLNLLGASVKDAADYSEYMKEFCETMNNPVLLFDNYEQFNPTDEKKDDHSNLFWNMAIAWKYAKEYKKAFWGYVTAGGQYNDAQAQLESIEYHPNEAQFDWAVNMLLAFGAKGINYFTISQPFYYSYGPSVDEYDFQRNGIIGADGSRTQWWYYAKNINTHIAAIDEVLMNSVSKGIVVTGEKATYDSRYITEEYYCDDSMILGTSWRELEAISGETVVGCFNYLGKTALYVVNYDAYKAQKTDLKFVEECNVKVIQNAGTGYVKGSEMTLDLAAGEGALLVFE